MSPSLDYLMVAPSFVPNVGGVERHVYEIHRTLKAKGMTGEVLVLHERPAPADKRDEGIWIDFTKGMSRRHLLRQWKSAWAFGNRLRKYPRVILHFHDFTSLYPFLPLLRILGFLPRTYVTFHGWEGIFPPEATVVRRRKACRQSVAGSINVGDFVEKWYGTPADAVTYGGVDVGQYGAIPTVSGAIPLHAAYVGRLEPDAGLPVLLQAFHECSNRRMENVKLSIFGSGSLQQDVLSKIRAGVGHVTLNGKTHDVASVFRDYPIVFASGYLTILEALCAGRVVFATYDNALRRDYLLMHPAASSLIICENSKDILQGLIRCRKKPDEVLKACQSGWQWAREQSWDRLADQYQSVWAKGGSIHL